MTEVELLQVIEQAAVEDVTELDLSFNQLSSLPGEVGQLVNLRSLDLSFNQLNSLPGEFGQLVNLQSLDLSINQFGSLPEEFGQLVNLRSLDLSFNQLSSLPEEFGQLVNLQSLDLSINQFGSLPGEIEQLVNLQSLDLSRNRLSSLPEEIEQLVNLQSLDLSRNQLSSLPGEIEQLVNLRSLNLYNNQLSGLPGEMGQLVNLRSLNLYNNQLESLPRKIGQLINLQSLNLYNNQLKSLPRKIGQLINLQSLNLSFNQFSSLLGEFGQLVNLQSLNLSFNQFSSLPEEIGQLVNLQSLNLHNNQLSSLPEEIGQLVNLQSLNLYNNQLSSLPGEIGQLVNLQSLNLHNNQLSSLPRNIGQLVKLQSLNLSFNQLNSLPREISQVTNLNQLELEGNKLRTLPPEIRGNGLKVILNFYKQQLEQETEPLYEAKLLIVGEGGVGKTSLAKKIQNETYELQSDEKLTEGIEVIRWDFTQLNGKDFRVNIWDFGGQEIYYQTHQFFLTKRSLYALVTDTRQENTNFYWWLNVVELLSDNSPVLIIKNEKQDRQCEVNYPQLRGEFDNLKEALATNLATNRGLPKIKQAIQHYISKLDHVGTSLPKLWVRIRSALENDPRNYINFHEYEKLCRVHKLTDRKDMLVLSRYLHDLGVCLHFQDDSTLKHYVILKLEWGTTAVYKVLDNKNVKKNLGCFTQENLADIWKDSEYTDMRDELLQLMMRFKLCYPIPNRPRNFIAPQLLDINQPNYKWDGINNLILCYEYKFLPKGIITRFIVETHPWIEQQKLVWRSGVVLHKNDTRAEVIENYNTREIKVRVVGNRKKELLAVVTHELDKIHKSFERLEYYTLVPCNCEKCKEILEPYTYSLDELYDFLKTSDYQIQCRKSRKMVDVRKLIDDVNLHQVTPLQGELEEKRKESLEPQQNTMKYQDFQILVTADRKIRVSSQQGEERGELQLDLNKIKLTLELVKQKRTNGDLLKRLGNELYQALFPIDVRGRLQATIASARVEEYNVRLRLVFESPELATLPWEFLYDERTNVFLANNTQTVLSRYIDVPLEKRELKAANLPLKVLLVISTPTDLPELDVNTEANLIRESVAKHIDLGQIELDILPTATMRDINQKLREKSYNVFHFIGHSEFRNNKGFIALVDTDNKANLLDEERFANFFLGNSSVGLVVLNSCQSATASEQQAFTGIAPNLVERGIPAVIAMQYSIYDTTAKLFADEFYRTLALGFPVDAAIQTTRNAISQEIGLDTPDFATPVLYMRAKDGIILSGL